MYIQYVTDRLVHVVWAAERVKRHLCKTNNYFFLKHTKIRNIQAVKQNQQPLLPNQQTSMQNTISDAKSTVMH